MTSTSKPQRMMLQATKKDSIRRFKTRAHCTGLLFFSFLCFLTACAQETHVATVNGVLTIQGVVEGVASIPEKLVGNIITEQGERRPIEGLSYDKDTGAFSFGFSTETDLNNSRWTSPPEALAAMGAIPPADPSKDESLGQTNVGFLRFELYPPDATNQSGVAQYLQATLPISRGQTLQNGGQLNVSSGEGDALKFVDAGFVAVKVVGRDGNPLAGAMVSSLAIKPQDISSGLAQPFLPWESATFAPIASLTNANGEAMVWPVPGGAGFPRYQILASAPAFCSSATPQKDFAKTATETLVLDRCDSNATTFKMEPNFAPVVKLFPVSEASTKLYGHVNQNSVPLVFHSRSTSLRPIEISVFRDDDGSRQAINSVKLPTFTSHYDYILPSNLTVSGSSLFRFVISSVATADEAPFVTEIYGSYHTSARSVTAKDYEIVSPVGVTGFIPAAQDLEFTVKVKNGNACKAGEEIGLIMGLSAEVFPARDPDKIKFKGCDSGTMKFRYKDLVSNVGNNSGQYFAMFVLRDRFGNISPRPAKNTGTDLDPTAAYTDIAKVHVDFGVPQLAKVGASFPLTLGVEFGILEAASAAAEPINFTTNGARISVGNIGEKILRFGAAGLCRLGADSESDPFNKIQEFQLLDQANAATRVNCATGKIALSENLVAFPASTEGAATLRMQVVDLSGQTSLIRAFEIPKCDSETTGSCWE